MTRFVAGFLLGGFVVAAGAQAICWASGPPPAPTDPHLLAERNGLRISRDDLDRRLDWAERENEALRKELSVVRH